MAKTAPYLYRRFANSIAAEVTFEAGTELVTRQGGILEYDASPKAKAQAKPRKPRKPRSLKWEERLPLSNTPPVGPGMQSGQSSGVVPASSTLRAPSVQPGGDTRLTPRQIERLETSHKLGLLNADGQRHWAEREARKALRQKVKAVSRG